MEGKDTQFLAEMYHLVKKMEELIEEFEVKDRLLASVVIGLFNEDDMDSEEETAQVKTMSGRNFFRVPHGHRCISHKSNGRNGPPVRVLRAT